MTEYVCEGCSEAFEDHTRRGGHRRHCEAMSRYRAVCEACDYQGLAYSEPFIAGAQADASRHREKALHREKADAEVEVREVDG